MSRLPFLGLDLSLLATGYAVVSDGALLGCGTLRSSGHTDLARVRSVRTMVGGLMAYEPRLVCVEGLAFASHVGRATTRAGMWWLVVDMLDASGCDVVVVEPARLKKFATGSGKASKDQMMLATARAFSDFDGDNNQADAVWLATLGEYIAGSRASVRVTAYRDEVVRAYSRSNGTLVTLGDDNRGKKGDMGNG